MAQDVIYPCEGSVCTWEKGEIHCFGVKCLKDVHLKITYIMIKVSIQEEDITIIHIYAPYIGALQYVRQMLTSMKGETNNNTIIVGDFSIPLTAMDRWTKQKSNKETQTLNDTIDQLDLIDIYRTFHPKIINFTFFSSAHRKFSRMVYIMGHKSSLGKLKKKRNHFKHLFWSQSDKIRCQLREKKNY